MTESQNLPKTIILKEEHGRDEGVVGRHPQYLHFGIHVCFFQQYLLTRVTLYLSIVNSLMVCMRCSNYKYLPQFAHILWYMLPE